MKEYYVMVDEKLSETTCGEEWIDEMLESANDFESFIMWISPFGKHKFYFRDELDRDNFGMWAECQIKWGLYVEYGEYEI